MLIPMMMKPAMASPLTNFEAPSMAAKKLLWLDGLMKGEFVCGDRFTLADILLFCFIEFGAQVGQPLPDGLTWLPAWHKRVAARPSAAA